MNKKKEMDNCNINILDINKQIINKFNEEKKNINMYIEQLQNINENLKINNLSKNINLELIDKKKELENYINDLNQNNIINFYLSETILIIEKYKNILNTPLKISFTGKIDKNIIKERNILVLEYINIIQKYIINKYKYIYIDYSNIINMKNQILQNYSIKPNYNNYENIFCNNCKNSKDFENYDDNIFICTKCSAEHLSMKYNSTYRDTTRINVSSKYLYDRLLHFKEMLAQFQGKQNSNIEQQVYDSIEKQLILNHIISDDKNINKIERFKNVTKEHIMMFLKETGYSKHYENVNLIHYQLTGQKPNDISHLEHKLINDFEILTETYDKLFKNLSRKSFINYQYILYQLLIKHKFNCKEDDFAILKTIDRKSFHDDIYKSIANKCGWTYKSNF